MPRKGDKQDPLTRLLKHVEKTATCWLWKGGLNKKGYGKCYDGARNEIAHIAFYRLLVGPIPSGLELDHICRVRRCVNPEHLEPVTHAENIRRGRSGAANREKTHCSKGHEFTPENTYRDKQNRRQCLVCKRLQRVDWGRRNKEHLRQYNQRRYKRRPINAESGV